RRGLDPVSIYEHQPRTFSRALEYRGGVMRNCDHDATPSAGAADRVDGNLQGATLILHESMEVMPADQRSDEVVAPALKIEVTQGRVHQAVLQIGPDTVVGDSALVARDRIPTGGDVFLLELRPWHGVGKQHHAA